MSEMLSDIKIVLKERVSGPFFGYIFISFILFNWDWLYFFIFSDISAEQKLSSISRTYDYFRGILAPVISGFIMCLFSPFINVAIKKLHSIAIRFSKTIDYDNDNDNSLEAIKADRALKNSLKRRKASNINNEIDKLEKQHQKINNEINKINSEITKLTDKRLELRQNEQELNEKINEATLDLQNKNATKENFENMNKMIEEKINENINLSSQLNEFEYMLKDISKYIEIKDGSRVENIALTSKVEGLLEKYGYKNKKYKVSQRQSKGVGAIPVEWESMAHSLENAWEQSANIENLAKSLEPSAYTKAMGKTLESSVDTAALIKSLQPSVDTAALVKALESRVDTAALVKTLDSRVDTAALVKA
ncbi:hypothetical protein ABUV69_005502, partial [Serratia liquefaciens]